MDDAADPALEKLIGVLDVLWLIVVIGLGSILVLYALTCAVLIPILRHNQAQHPQSREFADTMKAYLIVSPILFVNVVVVFFLCVIQIMSVNYIYRQTLNPGRTFVNALGQAADTVAEDVAGRIGSTASADPAEAVQNIIGNLKDFRGSLFYDLIKLQYDVGFFLFRFMDMALLAIVIIGVLRHLGVSSWNLLAFPIRRRRTGETWGKMGKQAGSVLVQMLLFTLGVSFFLIGCAIVFSIINGITLYVMAWLLVSCAAEVIVSSMEGAVGSLWIFAMFEGFCVMLFEVAILIVAGTSLLALGVTKSLRLRLYRRVNGWFQLDATEVSPAKLWPPLRAVLLLLLKTCGATFGVGILAFLTLRILPLFVSVPLVIFLEIVTFNVALYMMKVHRNLKVLCASIVYDVKALSKYFAEEPKPAPPAPAPPPSEIPSR